METTLTQEYMNAFSRCYPQTRAMKLVFQDYSPFERGESFPQFYENGDKVQILCSLDLEYQFWLHGIYPMEMGRKDFDRAYLMGGEL